MTSEYRSKLCSWWWFQTCEKGPGRRRANSKILVGIWWVIGSYWISAHY